MSRQMFAYFKELPIGSEFVCNGNKCKKRSTKTADVDTDNYQSLWFYFGMNDLCIVGDYCRLDTSYFKPKSIGAATAKSKRVKWEPEHFEALVSLYFQFLDAMQAGNKINKAAAIRELAASQGRTHKSIECVMSNVTSILAKRGLPRLNGKPLDHPHAVLEEYINKQLEKQ